jgi:hypothetical protein
VLAVGLRLDRILTAEVKFRRMANRSGLHQRLPPAYRSTQRSEKWALLLTDPHHRQWPEFFIRLVVSRLIRKLKKKSGEN